MVYEVITKQLQDELVYMMKFYDENGVFPNKKIRIDITLSAEIVNKLKSIENKSGFIETCIKQNFKKT
jgi:hypothetical protein